MQERESEGCKWEMRVKVEKENEGEGGWRGGNRGGGEERGVGTGLTGSIDSYVFIMT